MIKEIEEIRNRWDWPVKQDLEKHGVKDIQTLLSRIEELEARLKQSDDLLIKFENRAFEAEASQRRLIEAIERFRTNKDAEALAELYAIAEEKGCE